MFKNKNDHTIVQQFGDGMSDAFRSHLIKSIHLSAVSVFRPLSVVAIFRKTSHHTTCCRIVCAQYVYIKYA